MTACILRRKLPRWRGGERDLHLLATAIDTVDVRSVIVASCHGRRLRRRRGGLSLSLGHEGSGSQQHGVTHDDGDGDVDIDRLCCRFTGGQEMQALYVPGVRKVPVPAVVKEMKPALFPLLFCPLLALRREVKTHHSPPRSQPRPPPRLPGGSLRLPPGSPRRALALRSWHALFRQREHPHFS